jgi:hypothetical protein
MSIITLNEVKSHLGIDGSDQDLILQRIVSGVEQGVKRWTRRKIDRYEGEIEYHSGNGFMRKLYLRNRPVVNVSSVHIDPIGYFGQAAGAFDASTELLQGVDWAIEDTSESERNVGCLIYLAGCWPIGIGNIKITYDHGYSIAPADLRLGCLELCRTIYNEMSNGGVLASESLGDYSYSLLTTPSDNGDLRDAVRMIRPFKEVVL